MSSRPKPHGIRKPQACIKLLMAICSAVGQKVVDNRDALKALLAKP